MKIAGAPISWGVCEVPNWGFQIVRDRVLQEMVDVGIQATEFGPDGFLPESPREKVELLDKYGLEAIGGFVPVVLHDKDKDPLPYVDKQLDSFVAANADVLILAASSGADGYDSRPVLTAEQQALMYKNLDRLAAHARSRGIKPTLHPHIGTMVETKEDVLGLLENTDFALCLDTGHLLIGGTDPAELVKKYAKRVEHVHVKDVDLSLAKKVQSGELTYYQAVVKGMYTAAGDGDVNFKGVVEELNKVDYDGWYVLEQDVVVSSDPEANKGPIELVKRSVEFLKNLS